jgi:hypothetical protein
MNRNNKVGCVKKGRNKSIENLARASSAVNIITANISETVKVIIYGKNVGHRAREIPTQGNAEVRKENSKNNKNTTSGAAK